jgi:hypothetical protein
VANVIEAVFRLKGVSAAGVKLAGMGSAAKAAAQDTKRTKAGLDGIRKSAEAIQGPLGGMISRTIATGEAMGSMLTAASGAVIGIGALAGAILAPAGALFAVGKLSLAAIDASKSLDELRKQGAQISPLDPAIAASLARVEDNTSILSIEFSRMVALVGGQLSPAFVVLTTTLAGGLGAMADWFEAWQKWNSEGNRALALAVRLTGAIGDFTGITDYAAQIRKTTEANEVFADSLEAIKGHFDDAGDSARQAAKDAKAFLAELDRVVKFADGPGNVTAGDLDAIQFGSGTVETAASQRAAVTGGGAGLGIMGPHLASLAASVEATIKQASRDQVEAQVSTALSIGSSLASGNAIGALSVFGPGGAAAQSALGTLSQLGATGPNGERGVKTALVGMRSQLESIARGIEALPEFITGVLNVLMDTLPDILTEAVPAMVEALIRELPRIIVKQYEILVRLFVAQFQLLFTELPQAFAKGLTEWFIKAWASIKEFFSGLFKLDAEERKKLGKSAGRIGLGVATLGGSEIVNSILKGINSGAGTNIPTFARGSQFIREDTLAVLHKGNTVSPAGNSSQSMGGGGGGVSIHVQGVMTVDDLIRSIRQQLGDNGRGLTLGAF